MKLSIITINYNNATGLQKTFDSVFAQTFTGYEYIVIDGGSGDGSKALIEQHSPKIKYWVSEQDKGVYHAMNKGIQRATGEYVLLLNSGDCFNGTTILQQAFDLVFTESIVYADVKSNVTGAIISFPEQLSFSHFYHATINHQSTFIKRQLFIEHGLYNEDYKIASDWEFFMKCIFLKLEPARHLDLVLVEFDYVDGISTRHDNFNLLLSEKKEVLSKYFSRFVKDYEEMELVKKMLYERNQSSIKINPVLIKFLRKLRKQLQ